MDIIGLLHPQGHALVGKGGGIMGLYKGRETLAYFFGRLLVGDSEIHPRSDPGPLCFEKRRVIEKAFEGFERRHHVKLKVRVVRQVFNHTNDLQVAKITQVETPANRIVFTKILLCRTGRDDEFIWSRESFFGIAF